MVNVGMVLHYEGYTPSDLNEWSQRDAARYVPGDAIFQYAVDQGWEPSQENDKVGRALDWDDTINYDYAIIDVNWVECKDMLMLSVWEPVK